MIYTITFNPALDYVMNVEKISTNDINRATSEKIYYGGKGINVSAILKELDIPSVALGFVGGFTGNELIRLMNEDGIQSDFVKLESGYTRINVKIRSNKELDINADGPKIPEDKIDELFEKLDTLRNGDFLVLAGSIPSSLPSDIYSRIIKNLQDKDIKIVVDTSGKALINVLSYKPFLIKPNHNELGNIFGKEMNTTEKIIEYGRKLWNMGAQNVLISRGENGAVLLDENGKVHIADVVKGKLVNSVGCGDSMVAGFIAGYIQNGDYEYALKLSVATATATAFSPELAKKNEIEQILNKI